MKYIFSEETIYRILKEHKMNNKPKQHVADAPDQVWRWDITYLKTPIKGIFYYLYMIIDVFSRKAVGWEVHDKECQILSAQLLQQAVYNTGSRPGLVLHSDNGGAMQGATMLAQMQALSVVPSFSRPGVSDDNPFSESLFKTLKYRAWYLDNGFSSLGEAKSWVHGFVQWYNNEHCHSGIGYVTPQQRYSGEDTEILNKRRAVYVAAKQENPQRWSGHTRVWERPAEVILNPDGKTQIKKPSRRKSSGSLKNPPLTDPQARSLMASPSPGSPQLQGEHLPLSSLPSLAC
jgi:putative transposase